MLAMALFMPNFRKELSELTINENLIIECLNELNKNALAKKKSKDYYEGCHSILKSYQMQEEIL